jgi:hypothetical protein
MDRIINWLLLVIIFVFDPLAISLVVAANFAFAQAFPKREIEIDDYDDDEDDFDPFPSDAEAELYPPIEEEKEDHTNWDIEAAEKRMDIIGQNGNDGLHYDDTELQNSLKDLKDKMIDSKEIEEQHTKITEQDSKIKQLENELETAHEEINELDRAGIKLIHAIQHINDYLKHHGGGYDGQAVDLDKIKLGFAEKDDYIEEIDPYLKKGKDPDYPNIKTY